MPSREGDDEDIGEAAVPTWVWLGCGSDPEGRVRSVKTLHVQLRPPVRASCQCRRRSCPFQDNWEIRRLQNWRCNVAARLGCISEPFLAPRADIDAFFDLIRVCVSRGASFRFVKTLHSYFFFFPSIISVFGIPLHTRVLSIFPGATTTSVGHGRSRPAASFDKSIPPRFRVGLDEQERTVPVRTHARTVGPGRRLLKRAQNAGLVLNLLSGKTGRLRSGVGPISWCILATLIKTLLPSAMAIRALRMLVCTPVPR